MAPRPQGNQGRRGMRIGAAAALSFGVYADLAANMYSATNSSPQTTELFAGERSDTLWKYVKVGHAQALFFGVFGSILDRSLWPLLGTLSIGGLMHAMYSHALRAGQGMAPPSNADPTSARAASQNGAGGRVRIR